MTAGHVHQDAEAVHARLASMDDGDTDVEMFDIYVVGVGKDMDREFIKNLNPELRPTLLKDYNDFDHAVDTIHDHVCS